LSTREFEGITIILSQIVSINAKKPHESIMKITQDILLRVEKDLEQKKLDKKQIKLYEEEISRVSLFNAIFKDDLDRFAIPSAYSVYPV
jgi:hypothetical protein